MTDTLRDRLGYAFRDAALLRQALTHRSYGTPHNERLEFVGDAVLNCVIARALYGRFPDIAEGDLSRARASLVNQDTLAQVARRLDLGGAIRLGEGELRSGGSDRASILADGLEAVFGAVFLDGGYEAARAAVEAAYGDVLRDADPTALSKDPKTRLQELLQARRVAVPDYAVVATRGEAHAQLFDVECRIAALGVVTTGTGSSRRAAEQAAAAAALSDIARRGPASHG
ncbi:MAG TPA: ribonuclease III [Casimicrobiaceae bacterium]|jgi:ribonuclease-3|nr:ribonuclease III [Casimicrobiaceae bacterium]